MIACMITTKMVLKVLEKCDKISPKLTCNVKKIGPPPGGPKSPRSAEKSGGNVTPTLPLSSPTSAQHLHDAHRARAPVLRRTARGRAGLWPSRRTACDFIVAMRTITRSGQLVAALARLPPPARRSRCGACWHCCSSSRGGCRARFSLRETVGMPQAPAEGRDTSSHFNSGLCTPKSVHFCSCNGEQL